MSALPSELARIVERSIAADPEDRWQSVKDVKTVLEWASQSPAAPVAAIPRRLGIAFAAIALVAVVAAGVSWQWSRGTRSGPLRPLIRLEGTIPADTPLASNSNGGLLALSPDGSRLALTLRAADGKVRLYTRALQDTQLTPLAGTENAFSPFFSPDGQWIGFFADGKLKKVPSLGGGVITLADVVFSPTGASWGDDGNIIMDRGVGLWRVSSDGRAPTTLTAPQATMDHLGQRFPQVLPGSQAVLFTTHYNALASDNDNASINVLSMKTGQIKTLELGGYSGRYIATAGGSGRLIYLRRGTLFTAPFSIARLEVTGSPIPVVENVTSGGGGGNFAASINGTLVYASGDAQQGSWKLFTVDQSGKAETVTPTPAAYSTPRFSPDGKRLVFSIGRRDGSDLWIKDLDHDPPSRLTFLDGYVQFPVWTPDGKNIIFKHNNSMAWIRSDGAGGPHALTNGNETPRSVSSDGKRLAYLRYGDPYHPDAVTAPIEGDSDHLTLGKPEVFLPAPMADSSPMFSPDGRWMAYVSSESGSAEVYVRPFPGPGGRWQLSSGGGVFPVWSRDGRELMYQAPDQRLMAVEYMARGDSFMAGKPRVWSEARVLSPIGHVLGWDLAPDGKHIAGILEPRFGPVTFLLNFSDELERRIPR